MSQDRRSPLLELDAVERFDYMHSPEAIKYSQRVQSGEIPEEYGDDRWVVGVVIDNHASADAHNEMTELTYEPRDARQLKREYRRSYKTIVGELQAINDRKSDKALDIQQAILDNALTNMAREDARLLGGLMIHRTHQSNRIISSLFFSKHLSMSFARKMREIALSVDPENDMPENERTPENIEVLDKLANLERVNTVSAHCGVIVGALMPHPATVSPRFGKGKRRRPPTSFLRIDS